METNGRLLMAPRGAAARPVPAPVVPAPRARPDVRDWAELREQLAARAAELQQAVLTAADAARRYDAIGDHLLGGMHWRKAHHDEVRLAELERTYALVDDLARRDRARRDLPRCDRLLPERGGQERGGRDVAGLAA